jgi:hypothetical protein
VRAVLAVAIAIALLFGACGGDDDSNPATTSSGATKGATGKAAERSGARGDRSAGGQKSSRGRARKRGARAGGSDAASIFFYKGRVRCSTTPIGVLASLYQASSDDPEAIARAYAEREAPAAIYREKAADGCLAGIKSRRGG